MPAIDIDSLIERVRRRLRWPCGKRSGLMAIRGCDLLLSAEFCNPLWFVSMGRGPVCIRLWGRLILRDPAPRGQIPQFVMDSETSMNCLLVEGNLLATGYKTPLPDRQ